MEIKVNVGDGILNRELCEELFVEEYNRVLEEQRSYFKDLLQLSIKTGSVITLTHNQFRGFGKTSILLEECIKNNYVLVVSNNHIRNYFKEDGLNVICDTADIRGRRLEDKGFVVDGSVSDEFLREILRCGGKIIGGFKTL